MDEISRLPALLRYVMVFVDRVGFPILAFFLMFYMSYFTLKEVTKTLEKVNLSLQDMNMSVVKIIDLLHDQHR